MENKTKEQLAEEYANECEDCYSNDYLGFIRGYDSRQPEIDRLKNIISGKTFHDEVEVLKERIQTLTSMLGKIHDIVDKQNFNEDSDLHEIYKITHNSF